MRIYKIAGKQLGTLLRALDTPRGDRPLEYIRVAIDDETVKVKANEGDWSLPLGGPDPDASVSDSHAVDRAARAMHEDTTDAEPWAQLSAHHRDYYRARVRVVLAAYRGE